MGAVALTEALHLLHQVSTNIDAGDVGISGHRRGCDRRLLPVLQNAVD